MLECLVVKAFLLFSLASFYLPSFLHHCQLFESPRTSAYYKEWLTCIFSVFPYTFKKNIVQIYVQCLDFHELQINLAIINEFVGVEPTAHTEKVTGWHCRHLAVVCLQGRVQINVEETTWFCIPAGCSESKKDPFQHVKTFTAPNESSVGLFRGFLGDVGLGPNYSCIVGLCPSTDAFCAFLSSSTDRERPPGPSVNASRDGSPHSSVSASKVSCASCTAHTRAALKQMCLPSA